MHKCDDSGKERLIVVNNVGTGDRKLFVGVGKVRWSFLDCTNEKLAGYKFRLLKRKEADARSGWSKSGERGEVYGCG